MSAVLETAMQSEGHAPTSDVGAELAKRLAHDTVIRRDEPLARRTTLRVGGPADIYAEPASEKDLAAIVKFCGERKLPFFVLGRGSNLLVRDGGFRGVVVCLPRHPLSGFNRIEIPGERLHCGAGARLKNVSVEAKRAGLSGLEFLEGIPGSVGGALRMNAGAMGNATFDVVESVRLMDFDGNIHERTRAQMAVDYRSCATLKTHIALAAVLKASSANRADIEQRMRTFSQKRWESQPAAPSAGCIFKNPVTIPAGKLIDELGLKGARVGGATVSAEHGNFIVNDGTASARDVLELIAAIQSRARQQRGIELHTEVEIIGES
jgi:UDP-N-acetylenolpyruvoylglucosamine reductase